MQISEEAMKTLMLRSLDGDAQAYRELLGMVSAQLRAYFARRLEEDGEGKQHAITMQVTEHGGNVGECQCAI